MAYTVAVKKIYVPYSSYDRSTESFTQTLRQYGFLAKVRCKTVVHDEKPLAQAGEHNLSLLKCPRCESTDSHELKSESAVPAALP